MNRIIKYSFLGFILCISIELAFKLKYYQDKLFFSTNSLTPSEKYVALWESLSSSANIKVINSKRLFLIGDSFFDAEEYGGDESYVPYFSQLSLEENWEFFNLSLAGTSINDHKNIWSEINDDPNNIYVFSIKVHDVEKLNTIDILENDSFRPGGASLKSRLITLMSKSEMIYLAKDVLHQFFMWWKSTPAPYTHLHQVIVNPPEESLSNLSKFLISLSEKNGFIILLVNYPYNFKYDIKELDQLSIFNFFNNHNYPNLKILQSPLITNKKESVDWRNVHPNSTSMKEVYNLIKHEILSKK